VRLPVEPERLRRLFPSLTDEDLWAYAEVTRALLATAGARGRRLSEVLAAAQRGREKESAALPLDEDEHLALGYVRALAKMQGAVRDPGREGPGG
jgi:hypothetical protein